MKPHEIPHKFIKAIRGEKFTSESQIAPSVIDFSADPLGGGGNGYVFATNKRGVVLKLTTDENEYKIAANYHLEGIVKYYKTVELESGVYALWREECRGIGTQSSKAIDIAHDYASEIYDYLSLGITPEDGRNILDTYLSKDILKITKRSEDAFREKDLDVNVRLSVLLSLYRKYVMRIDGKFRAIGEALLTLLDDGWIMADAHIDNIGYVTRNGKKTWVIMDPGYCGNLLAKKDMEL